MYQLAILDLDGTLVNSIEDLANAVNHTLTEMHYPTHPLEAFYHFVGNGVKKLCERALPAGAPAEEAEQLLSRFYAYYEQHCLDCTRPYDGMIPALDSLKAGGMQLAVATNKPHKFAETIVKHFFGTECFDQILGSNDTRPRKPSPEILLEIMSACGAAPEETIMIGDSDVDILTARNAGMDSIGCTWGFRGKTELEQAGAVYLADSPSDLTEILKNH
ncbi:HAD family hydrolase [uncultured Ruminococcus sp.]|uniref:HAD family hydrolase n=1 Tax=uncultured Ruminococcus sp. TaxID=165186 RepID=UPI00262ABE75|nr:HAD-IA family hydrolase [uncultured Ruminococcus sp.]